MTRESVSTLARRDEPGDPLPLKLHGIFLDTTGGKVRAAMKWSTPQPKGGVIAAGGGRFVVLTAGLIALYSRTLELLNELRLSSEQQEHLWSFVPSPSGKSILVTYMYPERSLVTWIDVDSMKPLRTWAEDFWPVISDDELAFTREDYVPSQGTTHKVLIRTGDGPLRTFCRVRLGFEPDNGCNYPQFLSNDLLAFWAPHSLGLASAGGGNIERLATFREDDWLGRRLAPSADGKRFAVAVGAHKGGSALLDINYHVVLKRIMVFDIPSRRWIYTLNAKKQKNRTISGLAVSPDGSLMAIMCDGIVEVYRVAGAE